MATVRIAAAGVLLAFTALAAAAQDRNCPAGDP
jgi:hypothetical protein